MQIYLDHSATTPPRPEAIARFQEVLESSWGNPSSLHEWGSRAAIALETARMEVADLINLAQPAQLIFTAGGTEADNLAIRGITQQYDRPQHIIISSVEHSAVSEPALALEREGWRVTRLPVDHRGWVNPADLVAAIGDHTVLVSIIYGQSEVGTVQDIQALGEICRDRGVWFHSDGVQVAGRLPVDVGQLPVDLLSLSAHKIYGIQGAGALYVHPKVPLTPILRGGGQENRWRSGTQAVALMAAFGRAATLAKAELDTETPRLRQLQQRFFDLWAGSPDLEISGDRHQRLPHHLSFTLAPTASRRELTGKDLVRQLNLAGIAISAGSACNSGTLQPSPILKAMGYGDRRALSGIRLTMGHHTTWEDLQWTTKVLQQVFRQESS